MTMLPKPPKKRWYKRAGVWLIIVSVIILVIGIAVQRALQALTPAADVIQQTVTAEQRTLTKAVSSTGKIAAEQSELLNLAVANEVTAINVQVSDDVADGDILLKTAFQQLKAPFDGRVLAVQTFVGDTPLPGTTVLEIGYRTNFIDVVASESEVFDLVAGQSVELAIPTYDNGAATYHGVVESVANKKTTSVGSVTSQGTSESGYLVRIRPSDLPDNVSRLIDLTVNVKILIDQRDDVLSVERAAVQYREDDTTYVLLSGQVEQTVVTGFAGDDYVEIVSGLEAGDEVLLNIPKAETASPF